MQTEVIYTGIKAVDLFTPMPMGGDTLISGDAKAASRVLGMELAYRLAHRAGKSFDVTVFFDSTAEDAAAFEQEFRDSIPPIGEFIAVPSVSAELLRPHLAKSMNRRSPAFFAVSKRDVYIRSFIAAIKSLRAGQPESGPLTSIAVTEEIDADGFQTKIMVSRALAAEGIFPAIDPRRSIASASAAVPPEQREAAKAISAGLSSILADLHAGASRDPAWSFNSDPQKLPVLQALKFLSQPFYYAEPYTGLKSDSVSIDETIRTFKAILSGKYSGQPAADFYMKNSLVPEQGQAAG